MLFYFRGHPLSIVLDDDLDPDGTADSLDKQLTLTIHGLYAVGKYVHDHLVELAREALQSVKFPVIFPDNDLVLDLVLQ